MKFRYFLRNCDPIIKFLEVGFQHRRKWNHHRLKQKEQIRHEAFILHRKLNVLAHLSMSLVHFYYYHQIIYYSVPHLTVQNSTSALTMHFPFGLAFLHLTSKYFRLKCCATMPVFSYLVAPLLTTATFFYDFSGTPYLILIINEI